MACVSASAEEGGVTLSRVPVMARDGTWIFLSCEVKSASAIAEQQPVYPATEVLVNIFARRAAATGSFWRNCGLSHRSRMVGAMAFRPPVRTLLMRSLQLCGVPIRASVLASTSFVIRLGA